MDPLDEKTSISVIVKWASYQDKGLVQKTAMAIEIRIWRRVEQ